MVLILLSLQDTMPYESYRAIHQFHPSAAALSRQPETTQQALR